MDYFKNLKLAKDVNDVQVYKDKDTCIIAKEIRNIGTFSIQEQLNRRIHAHKIAHEYLPEFLLENKHTIVKSGNQNREYIVKKLMWLHNVRELRELPLNTIVKNQKYTNALSSTNRFILMQILKHKRVFDLTSTKYSKSGTGYNFINPNIYIGYSGKGKEKIFVDADWYFSIEDYRDTGFSKISYIKIMLGSLIQSVTTIFAITLIKLFCNLWK